LNAGVIVAPNGVGCLSTAMTDEHVARLATALRMAVREKPRSQGTGPALFGISTIC
jgi:glutamate-1-semialdehyde aminotransferase